MTDTRLRESGSFVAEVEPCELTHARGTTHYHIMRPRKPAPAQPAEGCRACGRHDHLACNLDAPCDCRDTVHDCGVIDCQPAPDPLREAAQAVVEWSERIGPLPGVHSRVPTARIAALAAIDRAGVG